MRGVQVQSLVGELRSHMTLAKKIRTKKQKPYRDTFNKDFKNGPYPKKSLKKKKKNHQTPWPGGEKKSRLEWPKLHHHTARDMLSGWGAGLLTGGHDPSFTSVVRRENERGLHQGNSFNIW